MKELSQRLRDLLRQKRSPEVPDPSRLTNDPDLLAGTALLGLLIDPRQWINRRVETIHLVDAQTQKRTVSIEFTAPASDTGSVVVPLAWLRKSPIAVDVRGENERPLAVLNRVEAEFLSWSALVAAAGVASRTADISRDERLMTALRDVVGANPQRAETAVEELLGGTDFPRRELRDSEFFRSILMSLSSGYLLLTRDVQPGEVNVARLRYQDVLLWHKPPLRARYGWSPVPFAFEIPGAHEAASYHFEMQAPRGLQIVEGSIWDSSTDQDVPLDFAPDAGSRVQLHLAARSNGSVPRAWVWLGATRGGTLARSLCATAASVFLLAVILWYDVREESVPALLVPGLGITGAAALSAGRRSNGPAVSQLLRGVGHLDLLSGLICVMGAVLLAVSEEPLPQRVWVCLATAALGCFAPIAVAYWRANPDPARPRGGLDHPTRREMARRAPRPPSNEGLFIGQSAEIDLPGPSAKASRERKRRRPRR